MTLKQETASVLAKFADKSNERKLVLTIIDQYKLDSPVIWPDYDKTINNPVMIGTVLKYIWELGDGSYDEKAHDLAWLWRRCGEDREKSYHDKSLNEIFVGKTCNRRGGGSTDNEVFMDDSVQALLDFIKTL